MGYDPASVPVYIHKLYAYLYIEREKERESTTIILVQKSDGSIANNCMATAAAAVACHSRACLGLLSFLHNKRHDKL